MQIYKAYVNIWILKLFHDSRISNNSFYVEMTQVIFATNKHDNLFLTPIYVSIYHNLSTHL